LVKSIRSATERANSAFCKLEKLITKYLSNRLAKALKYIKAEFLNAGHITWSKLNTHIIMSCLLDQSTSKQPIARSAMLLPPYKLI
jgi:hypothetical protein